MSAASRRARRERRRGLAVFHEHPDGAEAREALDRLRPRTYADAMSDLRRSIGVNASALHAIQESALEAWERRTREGQAALDVYHRARPRRGTDDFHWPPAHEGTLLGKKADLVVIDELVEVGRLLDEKNDDLEEDQG